MTARKGTDESGASRREPDVLDKSFKMVLCYLPKMFSALLESHMRILEQRKLRLSIDLKIAIFVKYFLSSRFCLIERNAKICRRDLWRSIFCAFLKFPDKEKVTPGKQ